MSPIKSFEKTMAKASVTDPLGLKEQAVERAKRESAYQAAAVNLAAAEQHQTSEMREAAELVPLFV